MFTGDFYCCHCLASPPTAIKWRIQFLFIPIKQNETQLRPIKMFHIQRPPRWSVFRNDCFVLPVIISPGGDIQNNLLLYTTHFFMFWKSGERGRKKVWRINLHFMLFVVNTNTIEPQKGSVSWDLQQCSVCDPAKVCLIYKVNTCQFGSAK
jgi:hypothetical protein